MQYEFIREIFNECANNQMRDIFFDDVETDNPDEYIKQFLVGSKFNVSKDCRPNGIIIFDVDVNGLLQRYTFTPNDN